MNSKRTCKTPEGDIRVTSYWLLGFVEGSELRAPSSEWGGLSLSKNHHHYDDGFSIGQTESESKVLEAIRKFWLELPGSYKTNRKNSNVVGIYKDIGRKAAKPMVSLTVRNPDFFINVLIPSSPPAQLTYRGRTRRRSFFRRSSLA